MIGGDYEVIVKDIEPPESRHDRETRAEPPCWAAPWGTRWAPRPSS